MKTEYMSIATLYTFISGPDLGIWTETIRIIVYACDSCVLQLSPV